MIKLTEEYSAAMLNTSPTKKDPECPTIDYLIGTRTLKMLYAILESVSVMPKKVFDKLSYSTLTPTSMCLQLADQSVYYNTGIAEIILIKIRNSFVLVDFVVLDMQEDMKTPLIL
jgi:hypothetical protein